MMKSREPVIFAEKFHDLIRWYKTVLGFEKIQLFEDAYHYGVLENKGGIRLGIADAAEMGVAPHDRANNSVVLQVEVPDVKQFFVNIEKEGGAVTFGPSYEEAGGFWFGGFQDVEGNPFWVVDENCP